MATTVEAPVQIAPQESTVPAGSSKRLVILTTAHATTHMRGAVLPLIYPLVMGSMGFGYIGLGAMLSATRLLGGVLQGVWGWVSQYVPAKWLLFGEQLGVGVGIWVTGASQNFGELTGAVALGQVAASPHHPLASSMVSRWYGKNRGSALSIHFAGANVATLISPLVFTFLALHWGWRSALLVFTIPCVVVAAAVGLGLPQEGRQLLGAKKRDGASAGQAAGGFFTPLRDPLVRRLILTACITAGGKGLGIVQTFIPLLLIRGMHMSTAAAGLIFTAFTATGVYGPIIAGRLSDRYSRPRFLSVMLAFSAVMGVSLAEYPHLGVAGLVAVLILFGSVLYACSPVEQAIMGDITSDGLSEQAYSLFYGLTFAISALWPVILTAVLARWGFSATFLVIAATYVAGFIIYGTQDWTPTSKRGVTAAG